MRRLLVVLQVAIPALIGAGVAVATVGLTATVSGPVGPGRVEVAAGWSTPAQTRLELPPFGAIAARTHRGPIGFEIRVEQIDVDAIQRLAAAPGRTSGSRSRCGRTFQISCGTS